MQICRIYVEVGECLVPLVMMKHDDAQILSILEVIMRCTDLPSEEISSLMARSRAYSLSLKSLQAHIKRLPSRPRVWLNSMDYLYTS